MIPLSGRRFQRPRPELPDHLIQIDIPYPPEGEREADRDLGGSVDLKDRRRDAAESVLHLPVIERDPVLPDFLELLLERLTVRDGICRKGLHRFPVDVLLAVFRRQIGEQDFADAGTIKRQPAADIGRRDKSAASVDLVEIYDFLCF